MALDLVAQLQVIRLQAQEPMVAQVVLEALEVPVVKALVEVMGATAAL